MDLPAGVTEVFKKGTVLHIFLFSTVLWGPTKRFAACAKQPHHSHHQATTPCQTNHMSDIDHKEDTELALSTPPDGAQVILSPSDLVYLCSNASMRAGERNHGKNTNTPREPCMQRLATSFATGCRSTSTLFILSAAREEWGTPLGYLQATIDAAKSTLVGSEHEVSTVSFLLLRRRICLCIFV